MSTLGKGILLFVALGFLSLTAAQAAVISVPVKGIIESNGSVELNVTFFGRAAGGRELFTTTKTFEVVNHIYYGMVDVPAGLFANRQQVFFEVARSSTPAIALGKRGQFTHRVGDAPSRAISIIGCSLCFTCGGSQPVFSGAWNTTSSPQTSEKASGCSGSATQSFPDVRPFLCCQ